MSPKRAKLNYLDSEFQISSRKKQKSDSEDWSKAGQKNSEKMIAIAKIINTAT